MKKLWLLLSLGFVGTTLFSTPTYAGGLNSPENLHLDHVECGTPTKSYAYFNWNAVNGDPSIGSYKADSYRFYSRSVNDAYSSFDVTHDTSYKLGFNPNERFYITVASTSTTSQGEIGESRAPEIYFETSLCRTAADPVVAIHPLQVATTTVQATPQTIITQPEIEPDPDVVAIKNKVTMLEKQMEQSQKKQSALENTLNNLLKWFHIHTPFFK